MVGKAEAVTAAAPANDPPPMTWTYMGQYPDELTREDLVRIIGELGADLTAERARATRYALHRFRCPFPCARNPRPAP